MVVGKSVSLQGTWPNRPALISGFCHMKWLRLPVLLLLHGRDSSPSQCYPPPPKHWVCWYHLYTWVEGGTVRVKCLTQEHNTISRPWLKPGPLDLEVEYLPTMRPSHLRASDKKHDSISLTNLSILKVKIFLKIISWLTDAQGTFLKLFVEESIEA